MSREVARLAGTNRLPPFIIYDVAIAPPPTSCFSIVHSSVSLSLSPRVYGEFMIYRVVSGSGPQGELWCFTAPDVSKALPTLFHPRLL